MVVAGAPTRLRQRLTRAVITITETWVAYADETESDASYIGGPIGISASWTPNGTLLVLARGPKAVELHETLVGSGIAHPDNPQWRPDREDS